VWWVVGTKVKLICVSSRILSLSTCTWLLKLAQIHFIFAIWFWIFTLNCARCMDFYFGLGFVVLISSRVAMCCITLWVFFRLCLLPLTLLYLCFIFLSNLHRCCRSICNPFSKKYRHCPRLFHNQLHYSINSN